MDTLIRGAVIGIAAAVIGLVLKKTSPELALLLVLAAGIVIIIGAAETAVEVLSLTEELAAMTGMSPTLTNPVLKCTGIAIVSKLTSDVCKDAGAASAASAIELVGAVSGIAVSIPLIRAVISAVSGAF